jgi:hypothetical protein
LTYVFCFREEEILEVCSRVWGLTNEYDKQSEEVKKNCFLETLMKGCFSLLGIKFPKAVLRLSACSIYIFFKIFDKYKKANSFPSEFSKILNYLYETIRGLLIYSKEGKHDILFKEENLIILMGRVVSECLNEHAALIVTQTTKTVSSK